MKDKKLALEQKPKKKSSKRKKIGEVFSETKIISGNASMSEMKKNKKSGTWFPLTKIIIGGGELLR